MGHIQILSFTGRIIGAAGEERRAMLRGKQAISCTIEYESRARAQMLFLRLPSHECKHEHESQCRRTISASARQLPPALPPPPPPLFLIHLIPSCSTPAPPSTSLAPPCAIRTSPVPMYRHRRRPNRAIRHRHILPRRREIRRRHHPCLKPP
jgi:hypothetical protein